MPRIFNVELEEGMDATLLASPIKIDGTPLIAADINQGDSEAEESFPVWVFVYEKGSTFLGTSTKAGTTIPGGTYPPVSEGLVMRKVLENAFSRAGSMQAAATVDVRWPHGQPGYTFFPTIRYTATPRLATDDLDSSIQGRVNFRAGNVYRVEFALTTDSGDSGVGGAGIGRIHIVYDVKIVPPGLRSA